MQKEELLSRLAFQIYFEYTAADGSGHLAK